jgi:signal transduction histidine kinase
MFLIIVVWATLLTLTTVIVRRSILRSATRFKAQLEAAGTVSTAESDSPPDLVLDPTTARLQDALRSFLRDQRERQKKVASRLAHTDQLASLGQLAAGLAHEIKNPLAGIQGALEILKEDEEKDTTRLLYGEMLSELDRVNSTLHSLLSSARPTPPQISTSDAKKLVEDVQRLVAPGLRRRRIALETDFAAGEIVAPFDAAKIRQILINLIQNAADAIEEDGVISVSVARCPDGTGAIFVVEDDGPGIPEEHQKNIFEPFFTTKFTGTGLGLSITRGLVEQHGGTIDFETSADEGTTFFVILPEGEKAPEVTKSRPQPPKDED